MQTMIAIRSVVATAVFLVATGTSACSPASAPNAKNDVERGNAPPPDAENAGFINEGLQSAAYRRWTAEYSRRTPVRFAPAELQQDGRITLSPGFTPDGTTIYFGQSECAVIGRCPQRLKRSDLTSEGWSAPRLVELPQDARGDSPSVTPDGKNLLFTWSGKSPDYGGRDRSENFDLWNLDLTRLGAEPIPLRGPNINTLRAGSVRSLRYVNNETLPILTKSGNLYFMTERLEGIGERDIYLAKKGTDQTFLQAEPLPAPINSSRRDDGVWVDPEETIMLVSYPDRGGIGQDDIFISFRVGETWADPVNVGARINSPARDLSARLTPDLKTILFTSDRPVPGQPDGLLQVWSAKFDIQEYQPPGGETTLNAREFDRR